MDIGTTASGPDLKRELEYYKKQLEQMSGDSIRYDFMLSSLRHELKQKQEAFAVLASLQKAFTVATPEAEVLQITVKAINTQLGMDRSLVLLAMPETNRFSVGECHGFSPESVTALGDISIEIPLSLLQPGRHLLYNKSAPETELVHLVQMQYGITYFIGLPLFKEETPFGFLLTGRQFEKHPFHPPLNKGDVDTIAAISGLIGTVFQNKQLLKLRLQVKEQVHENATIRSMLAELKATQAQLIQREKMASLGELTAGIAHEIQNPLNFVNNFSDINRELLEELKQEATSGNLRETINIADTIAANEQKISDHGRRADAIVKSMLQHSRQSNGERQLTDINALCDEYLKLAYHGLRAKDKNFNATIHTHFDTSIGKIDIVPQDMGRVLLNLFNNAFYSVQKKKQQLNGTYEPAVFVKSEKTSNKVRVRIEDNGTGIPENVVSKIFQPFFTTKPTGEGTGLGLSLSYDMVKAHGGGLQVESKEGDYAAFIIELPLV